MMRIKREARYAESEKELQWFFSSNLGLHAQAYDPDRTGIPFDSNAALASRMDEDAQKNHRRYRLLEATLAQLLPSPRALLTMAYQPRGRDHLLLRAFMRTKTHADLIGIALQTRTLVRAYRLHMRASRAPFCELPSPAVLLRFLEWEAGQNHRKVLDPVRAEAEHRLDQALGLYDRLREDRVVEERRLAALARAQHLAQIRSFWAGDDHE